MAVVTQGYPNQYTVEVKAGSDTAKVVAFPSIVERVDITQLNGSPAYVAFDGFLGSGVGLTPYTGSVASGCLAFKTASGTTVSTFNVHTGSVQMIGSTGSPIGASDSTFRLTGYF